MDEPRYYYERTPSGAGWHVRDRWRLTEISNWHPKQVPRVVRWCKLEIQAQRLCDKLNRETNNTLGGHHGRTD